MRRFVADVALPNMLYAAFYRSPHAHAQLKRLDLSPALASEGVVLAITAKELRERVNNMKPFPFQSRDPFRVGNPQIRFHDRVGLADDKVRFVGEPVALIVAESRYLAEDAVGDLSTPSTTCWTPSSTRSRAPRPARRSCTKSGATT